MKFSLNLRKRILPHQDLDCRSFNSEQQPENKNQLVKSELISILLELSKKLKETCSQKILIIHSQTEKKILLLIRVQNIYFHIVILQGKNKLREFERKLT